jgi:hypothetical protein
MRGPRTKGATTISGKWLIIMFALHFKLKLSFELISVSVVLFSIPSTQLNAVGFWIWISQANFSR